MSGDPGSGRDAEREEELGTNTAAAGLRLYDLALGFNWNFFTLLEKGEGRGEKGGGRGKEKGGGKGREEGKGRRGEREGRRERREEKGR